MRGAKTQYFAVYLNLCMSLHVVFTICIDFHLIHKSALFYM